MADRTISYNFRGNFTNLTAGLTAAGRSVQDFGGRLTALDRDGDRMRRGLTTIGDGAGKMGLVAAAGFGVIIAATARFDKAMSAVQAATGESAAGMEKLRAAAITAGADTVFSATEAAEGITELGKAGLSTADILSGGLAGALDLAAAGQISVASAAETTATTLSQFGLAGDQASRVADTLAASAGKALGSVDDMAEALKYVGPVASQMGLSLEDTSGAIAELASQGILGSQAGTSLRGMLTSLTSPSKQASLTMTGLGISMYDAEGKFVGLEGIAGQLHDTMSGLTSAERDQALGRIFGNEQVTAARILYAGGAEAVQDWTDKVTDSGFAAKQAAQLTNNLAGDLEALKGSLETALIGAGEGQTGMLRGLTQKATEAVNVFNDLPGPIKTTATGLLAITAVTGGAAFFGAKVVAGIAATNVALAELGFTARVTATSLATAGASIGALAVVSAGYGSDSLSITDSWNRSREASDSYGNSVAQLTSNLEKSNVGKFAADLGIDLNKLAADLAANGENGAYVSEVMDQLSESGHGASAMFSGFASGVLPFYTSESDKASAASSDLRDVIEGTSLTTDVARSALTLFALSADDMDAATQRATLSLGAIQGPAMQTAEEVVAAAKAQDEATKAANSTATAFFNLGDSLNDSKVSLDGWIDNLQKQAQALADFRKNATEAADKGLRQGLIAALQEAGPEGAMRLAQLADASQAQIGRANKAWKRGQDQINAYTNEVGKVPTATGTTVTTEAGKARSVLTDVKGQMTALGKMVARVLVDANTSPAASKIAGIKRELATIPDENVNVNVRRVNVGGMGPQLRAAGGYISGAGTATSDSIPARLSNGEYVIKASSVAKYGVAMFDGLNSQRYATGGKAGDSSGKRAAAASRARGKARSSLGDLGVDLGVNAQGASDALAKFQDDLENVRGLFKDAHLKWSDALKKQTGALTESAKKYDSLNATLAQTKSAQADFASAVGGQFNHDIFGNGVAGLGKQLQADSNDAASFQSALASAVAQGLDGGLFSALAQSGDLNTAQQLAASGAGGIASYEQMYAQREANKSGVGNYAGAVQYGAQVAAQTVAVRDMQKAIQRLEKNLPGAVKQGAKEGTHEGAKDGIEGKAKAQQTAIVQNSQTKKRGGRNR